MSLVYRGPGSGGLLAETPSQHVQPVVAEKHLVVANKGWHAEDAAGVGAHGFVGQRCPGLWCECPLQRSGLVARARQAFFQHARIRDVALLLPRRVEDYVPEVVVSFRAELGGRAKGRDRIGSRRFRCAQWDLVERGIAPDVSQKMGALRPGQRIGIRGPCIAPRLEI